MSDTTYDQYPVDRDYGPTVLIVDDNDEWRDALKLACEKADEAAHLRVLATDNISDAMKLIASTPIHVVLLDKNLSDDESDPHGNGIEEIPAMRQLQPSMQILVITSSEDHQDTVRAITLGAFGYVVKKWSSQLMIAQINKALEMATLTLQRVRSERTHEDGVVDLVGRSKEIRQVRTQAEAVAESSRPVLFTGENGTGKTVAARMVHEFRKKFLKQKDRPFFDLNIGAIAPELIESELFGTEPGAYTGASTKTKIGFVELANNGTLFLDEIGEISEDIQVKLLKVIEKGTFYRVGGTKERHSNFKLICATNRNLPEMIAQGTFREDLYMRLSTFCIRMPSLNERKEDIPDIIEALLPSCCKASNVYVAFKEIPQDFIQHLTDNLPRGNFRGIDHQISRLLTLSTKDRFGRPLLDRWRDIEEFGAKKAQPPTGEPTIKLDQLLNSKLDLVASDFPGISAVLDHIEEQIILDAKSKYSKNVDMARALKISEGSMSLRLKQIEKSVSQKKRSKVHMVRFAGPKTEVVQ